MLTKDELQRLMCWAYEQGEKGNEKYVTEVSDLLGLLCERGGEGNKKVLENMIKLYCE